MGLWHRIRPLLYVAVVSLCGAVPAHAWDWGGEKTVYLHDRNGEASPIGTVVFEPEGDKQRFSLMLDHSRFTDYFLSMREFKCVEGSAEILCHVPYPYPNPTTVTQDDLRWLEHALLFLFKTPDEFGARLWNGVYFQLAVTDEGIVGTPQAIDLNHIGAPPADASLPPFTADDRSEIEPGARWFERLSIR